MTRPRAAGIPPHRIVERVATFYAGTPIANSLGELWVMQTHLRPDLLEAAGVAELGDWGAAFTATHTTVEVNATGPKLQPVTKVGKFTQLPALLTLSSAYSDVVTRDQVPVKLPTLVGSQREIVTLKPDIEVVEFHRRSWLSRRSPGCEKPAPRQHPQGHRRRPKCVVGPPAGRPSRPDL
jgi:N12 class adenine-specific DNA methylase